MSSSSSSSSSSSIKKLLISYCTDVEGNLDYWRRYIQRSNILTGEAASGNLQLRDYLSSSNSGNSSEGGGGGGEEGEVETHFVYGGDVCDRGAGDMRVLRDLVHLKRAYPSRVHLIIGNRDANKLRLPVEMHPSLLSLPPSTYWTNRDNGVSPASPSSPLLPPLSSPAADRLQWNLVKSMGSPLAFNYRRKELEELGLPSDDDAVVASYLALIMPPSSSSSSSSPLSSYEGLLLEYLREGNLAVRLGDVLFVHGAVLPHNKGWLPPSLSSTSSSPSSFLPLSSSPSSLSDPCASTSTDVDSNAAVPACLAGSAVCDDVGEWVQRLNAFSLGEVMHYQRDIIPFLRSLDRFENKNENENENSDRKEVDHSSNWSAVGGYNHAQPCSRLLQYGMGWMADGTVNPSIIYANYSLPPLPSPSPSPSPSSLSKPTTENGGGGGGEFDSLIDWLNAGGVRKVVVGHQPRGDAPLLLPLTRSPKLADADGSADVGSADVGSADVIAEASSPEDSNDRDSNDRDRRNGENATINRDIGRGRDGDSSAGVLVVSADTSYAVNAQWEKEGVWAAHSNTINANANANAIENPPPVPPPADSTRGAIVAEILISISISPSNSNSTPSPQGRDISSDSSSSSSSSSSDSSNSSSSSSVYVDGVLSNGCEYHYQINDPFSPSPTIGVGGSSSNSSSSSSEAYLGKRTSAGWFVKAANVHTPTASSSSSAAASASQQEQSLSTLLKKKLSLSSIGGDHSVGGGGEGEREREGMYLLTLLEGFVVKNKLVSTRDISAEFLPLPLPPLPLSSDTSLLASAPPPPSM